MKKVAALFTRYKYYLYPFVIALYTVLFLYANNIKEYRLHVLWVPIVLVTVFTFLVYAVAQAIFKNLSQSALLTGVIVFITLSYNRLLGPFGDDKLKMFGVEVGYNTLAIFVTVALLAILVIFIIKKKAKLLLVNKLLTILSLVLVCISLYTIVSFEVKTKRMWTEGKKGQLSSIQKGTPTATDPDIYYFIFDRYAGPRSLQEQYDFDNSQFLSSLEKKGFYVSTNSTTNYPKTFLSLASSLNMEYVNFLTKTTNGGASADESVVTPYIQNSKVLEFLKKRGYTFINVGSWWEPTRTNPNADTNYFPPKKGYLNSDEFTTGFLNTTIAAPLFKVVFHDPLDVSTDPQNNIHRQAALYEFKTIGDKVVKTPGPKFVFTHILLPHDPFVFDKNCNPLAESEVNKYQHQENYVNQIQCANSMIEKMVDVIIKDSKNPPIIVLQADEGPFPMNVPIPKNQAWGTAEDTSLREKFPIFNAYYTPGKKDIFYETITPVNTFRTIFSSYFGTKYPLLEDKNYVFQDEDNLYKFIDVTDRVKN